MKATIFPILATVESASAAVAITLIVCPTIILTTAVIRHKINDVVKLAGYFTTFLGFLLGAFITYFSTQPQIQRQEFQIRTIQGELQTSEKEKVAVGKELLDVATNIRRHGQSPEAYQAAEMLDAVAAKLLQTTLTRTMELPGRSPSSPARTMEWRSPSAHATPLDLLKRPSPSATP
ncbi:MAG TPA: hypothetical protein VFU37_05825 [Pyrinomonadaceae bacterium]|nr:hypothetical protein [Pyrinomonadaceae bacterium]